KTGIYVDRLDVFILFEPGRRFGKSVGHTQLPVFGCKSGSNFFGRRIYQNHSNNVIRISAGVQAGKDATKGMRGEDIRSWDMRRLEQSMKIGNNIARGARHSNWGAPTQMIRVKQGARTVISANPRKL